ncbi:transcriptional regulator [Nocardia mangyaensis]|uniref:Transcriptional regulator n=1 Tax=Nocardia mangyaensis TaxID=2213200 RepID=A0A1J0VQU6_9NOCA|nr:metalloregulator ArsR/SmtB family transcription factor [Nocardia mangyaensis]APE34327.1 transcriptional regulator [Nocardia mangyaensis]MDO3648343.1 metalloregulator ArsR/SmtB family transcription factor [Nocardia mangyaensis]
MAVSPSLDPEHASRAASALNIAGIEHWAGRFDLLSDVNRLRLLLCLHHAPDISVSDLAAAVGMSATATSQALRLLRQQGWVAAAKDGRIVRYRLADDTVHQLLHWIGATHAEPATTG